MSRFFDLPVPYEILKNATAKDLKCTGKRYEEAMMVNQTIASSSVLPAMQRYTGVLYGALGYATMTAKQQQWIDEHVLILS
ncbi:peroxide stress protein YaaA [Patescibacteria group bacterium]|nr:peroxide stress protein YaaA [Patescibacteria group bacterium]